MTTTAIEHAHAVDEKLLLLLRQKSPAERTALASNMFTHAREMLSGFLKQQHPDWTHDQIQAELRRRIHGKSPIHDRT